MTTVRAPDLAGFEDVLARMVRRLVEDDDAVVVLPSVGRLAVAVKPGRLGRNPVTGEPIEVRATRSPTFTPGTDGTSALAYPDLDALASAVRARFDAGEGAHLPGLGTLARLEGEVRFLAAAPLRRRMQGDDLAPMDDTALDEALARFAAEPFGVRELQTLLAPCRAAAEPEDDVLVDLPAGLPKLLRAALARSAELGNQDRLGFLIPMRREWAWSEFAPGRGGPPDVFFVSNAGPWPVGRRSSYWVLALADLGQEDPTVVWCEDHATFATSPHRTRLSTWMRLFALETVLGPLDPPRVTRVRAAVQATCPEVATTWPERWVGQAPDPWLRQVVLTW